MIKVLVKFGADVNIRGDDGLTPLHYAARFKISPQSERKTSQGLLVSTYQPESLKDQSKCFVQSTNIYRMYLIP